MTSNESEPFRLPAPKFEDETRHSLDSFTKLRNPHFSTPSGMLLPRDKQPPPMYGPRGSTVPPRFLNHQQRHGSRGRPYGGRGGYQHRFRGGSHHRPQHFEGGGVERDVIPELLQIDWALWCEGCDVNCRTEEQLKAHVAEHRGCEVEGCRFVGHPGVMKRHWKSAHDEKRLEEKAQLDTKQTPEEIERWRLERKKRFPTKENVERRQQAQQERFQRGERIEEDKRRFPNRNQQEGRNPVQRNVRNEPGQHRRGGRRGPTEQKKPVTEDCNESESRMKFRGTSCFKDYKEKVQNSLSLLSGYGSSDSEASSTEEEDLIKLTVRKDTPRDDVEAKVISTNPESLHISDEEPGEEAEQSPEKDNLQPSNVLKEPSSDEVEAKTNPESLHISDDEPEEGAEQIPEKDNVHEESNTKRRNRSRKRRNNAPPQEEQPVPAKVAKPLLDYSKLRHARQNTMLEKLLEPNIRHERNVLLQCVRFVVENKFFGIGQPKQSVVDQEPNKAD